MNKEVLLIVLDSRFNTSCWLQICSPFVNALELGNGHGIQLVCNRFRTRLQIENNLINKGISKKDKHKAIEHQV